MPDDKKLFTPEDFDKQKKLFAPKDFDKDEKKTESDSTSSVVEENSSQSKPYLLWIVVAAILALVAFLLYKGCSDKQASTEVDAPAQSAGTTASVQDSTRRDTVSNVDTASSPMPSETQSGSNAEVTRDERVQTSNHTTNSATVPEPAADNASVETKAKDVIRGKYGNGQIRKDRLGASYTEIQGRVNEMYRQGLVN